MGKTSEAPRRVWLAGLDNLHGQSNQARDASLLSSPPKRRFPGDTTRRCRVGLVALNPEMTIVCNLNTVLNHVSYEPHGNWPRQATAYSGNDDSVATTSIFSYWKEAGGNISFILLVRRKNINSLVFPGPRFEKRLKYIRECDIVLLFLGALVKYL
jgi:hypothetical protein